jgi:hypothetical protein
MSSSTAAIASRDIDVAAHSPVNAGAFEKCRRPGADRKTYARCEIYRLRPISEVGSDQIIRAFAAAGINLGRGLVDQVAICIKGAK